MSLCKMNHRFSSAAKHCFHTFTPLMKLCVCVDLHINPQTVFVLKFMFYISGTQMVLLQDPYYMFFYQTNNYSTQLNKQVNKTVLKIKHLDIKYERSQIIKKTYADLKILQFYKCISKPQNSDIQSLQFGCLFYKCKLNFDGFLLSAANNSLLKAHCGHTHTIFILFMNGKEYLMSSVSYFLFFVNGFQTCHTTCPCVFAYLFYWTYILCH